MPADLPALVQVLTEQQPSSGYALRWPLPFPVEQFIVRSYEQAWVAERDGHVVGHVMIGRVEDEEAAAIVTAAPGRDELATVSVLFVAQDARGLGIGKLLLDTAVDWTRTAWPDACVGRRAQASGARGLLPSPRLERRGPDLAVMAGRP